MKNFGVVIILFMLSGCFSKTGNYASSLQNWVGQPEYVLYQSWGQPENTFYLSEAEKEVPSCTLEKGQAIIRCQGRTVKVDVE